MRISGQTINAAISGISVNGSLTILLVLDLQPESDLTYTALFGNNKEVHIRGFWLRRIKRHSK